MQKLQLERDVARFNQQFKSYQLAKEKLNAETETYNRKADAMANELRALQQRQAELDKQYLQFQIVEAILNEQSKYVR